MVSLLNCSRKAVQSTQTYYVTHTRALAKPGGSFSPSVGHGRRNLNIFGPSGESGRLPWAKGRGLAVRLRFRSGFPGASERPTCVWSNRGRICLWTNCIPAWTLWKPRCKLVKGKLVKSSWLIFRHWQRRKWPPATRNSQAASLTSAKSEAELELVSYHLSFHCEKVLNDAQLELIDLQYDSTQMDK